MSKSNPPLLPSLHEDIFDEPTATGDRLVSRQAEVDSRWYYEAASARTEPRGLDLSSLGLSILLFLGVVFCPRDVLAGPDGGTQTTDEKKAKEPAETRPRPTDRPAPIRR
jgi:hypothetical protein